MNRSWIPVAVAVALVALAFVALPAPGASAAGITSISIDYFPANIPTDAASPCSSGGGTPFAVRITVSGAADQNFVAKLRLGTGACTWRPDTGVWITDGGAFTSLTRGTIEPDGDVSLWLYGRANANATTSLTVRGRGCDATWTTCADNIDAPAKTVTLLDMSSSGGWLEETNGSARAGRAVAVKDGATIIGLYVAEDNGVNEGYPADLATAAPAAPAAPGYTKVAVPACATCNYTVESWTLAAPGTPVGTVNTMGAGGCPNVVTAGNTTSLNTCANPTTVTLRTLVARAPYIPLEVAPVFGLTLVGGVLAWRRLIVAASNRAGCCTHRDALTARMRLRLP